MLEIHQVEFDPRKEKTLRKKHIKPLFKRKDLIISFLESSEIKNKDHRVRKQKRENDLSTFLGHVK